jgi:acyl CoA:acetate/3-ketoacid CoA transferase
MVADGHVAAYNLPAGMIAPWHREIGAGRPGAFTRTGLGTFVDPRIEGGRMNAAAKEDLLSIVNVRGEDLLHFPSATIDVALIRATTADEDGNLTFEHEPAPLIAFAQAAAARYVVAQVKRVCAKGAKKPHEVKVPGSLVDAVVIEPDALQAGGIGFDPSLSGETRRDELVPSVPSSESERWIVERAAHEIAGGGTGVLGYGMSAYVPHLMLAEGRFDQATFAIEQGSWGGLPLTDFGFGSSINPTAILDACSQFDLFGGGHMDTALLSFLQVDERGRVNVHRLDARPALSAGIGGFLDIAANAPKLVLMGSLTAGKSRQKKFVRRIDHISYDPVHARNREVLYITDKAVFRLESGRLSLIELAPGADLGRDILPHMEFQPAVR